MSDLLETPHLTLRPTTAEQIRALIDHPERFEAVVGLPAGDGLHGYYTSDAVSPTWLAALRNAAGADPWQGGFFVIHRAQHCVIGAGGFKGPPDSEGMVEIGYGIVPAFEGRGFATEVARALVDYARASGRVRLTRAHTMPVENASTHVLRKCGFTFVGPVVDPEDGDVWRWERVA